MMWGAVGFWPVQISFRGSLLSLPVVSYFYLGKVVESLLLLSVWFTQVSVLLPPTSTHMWFLYSSVTVNWIAFFFWVDDILRFGKYRSTFFSQFIWHFMDQITTRLIERATGGLSDDENNCRVPIFSCHVTFYKQNVKRGEWLARELIKKLTVASGHSFSKLPPAHSILWHIYGTVVTYQPILITLS